MTDWFLEIGPSISNGMGETSISHQELRHWQDNIGIELGPWEARTLIEMSNSFLSERQKAKKTTATPPYSGDVEIIIEKRALVSHQVKSVFSNLKGKKG